MQDLLSRFLFHFNGETLLILRFDLEKVCVGRVFSSLQMLFLLRCWLRKPGLVLPLVDDTYPSERLGLYVLSIVVIFLICLFSIL